MVRAGVLAAWGVGVLGAVGASVASVRAAREGLLESLPESLIKAETGLPVILVHGFNSNRFAWSVLADRLRGSGLPNMVFSVDLIPPWESLTLLATQLKDFIDEVKELSGRDKVVLVAHSMGGLVSRLYIEGALYEGDVDTLVTVASPHRGASLIRVWPRVRSVVGSFVARLKEGNVLLGLGDALAGLDMPAAVDLTPESDVVRFLVGRLPKPSVKYLSVAGNPFGFEGLGFDGIVFVKETVLSGIQSILLPVNHAAITDSDDLFVVIKRVLE